MADSDESRHDQDQFVDESSSDGRADARTPGEDGAVDALGEGGEAESDPLGALQAEVATLTDQLLRSQAEAENVRRRAARDVESARKYALEKFTADLLPVVDSLEKAVEAADGTGEANAIREGVALSLKLFLDVLERAGIQRIHPMGEPFDPQFHEAMSLLPAPDAEPNSVLHVMQAGYTLNGRLVRPAMVVVSKAADS